nr:MAG TPA_asm: hypothetical protein [Bacteriophage sp.]
MRTYFLNTQGGNRLIPRLESLPAILTHGWVIIYYVKLCKNLINLFHISYLPNMRICARIPSSNLIEYHYSSTARLSLNW